MKVGVSTSPAGKRQDALDELVCTACSMVVDFAAHHYGCIADWLCPTDKYERVALMLRATADNLRLVRVRVWTCQGGQGGLNAVHQAQYVGVCSRARQNVGRNMARGRAR